MKILALVLTALTPLASQAATDITCKSQGMGSELTIKITASEGLGSPKARVVFDAQGMLHTVFQTEVDEVLRLEGNQVGVRVSTLNEQGAVDQNSGIATLVLDTKPFYHDLFAAGTGSIRFEKMPVVQGPLRLLREYALTDCKGIVRN